MKKIYWQQHNLPRIIMVIFCLFVLVGLGVVEHYKEDKPQPYFKEKYAASALSSKAFHVVKELRKERKIPFSKTLDPQFSGLIGEPMTSITSDSGDLTVKQTTINSNIAALFVAWLKQVGLKSGDVVAIGMTGSFPALDISMLSAIHALQLKPLLIFSGAASQYGANIPKLTWLDMFYTLKDQGVFPYDVLAASIGGKQDRGFHMGKKGVAVLKKDIQKNNAPFLEVKNTRDSINQRMALYKAQAGESPVRAYINVGGGMASIGLKEVGPDENKDEIKPHSLETGVITKLPIALMNRDSVAIRYLKAGVPVVNVHNVGNVIIHKYGFPVAPAYAPFVGSGSLFHHKEYRTWLTGLCLALSVLLFLGVVMISKKYMIRYKS